MKRNLFFLAVVISGSLVFQSCSPVYIPNTVNAPLLSNKGEVQASVNIGISGIDPQLAVAVTENIGLMLNASFYDMNNTDPDGYKNGRLFIEGGIGYYKPFYSDIRFETFGGFGVGEINGYFENNVFSGHGASQYRRVFIQPDIGFCTDVFDISLAGRLCFVNIVLTSDSLRQFSRNTFDPFFEPTITVKVGYKYVKFVTQFGVSFPLRSATYHYDQVYYNYVPIIFSVGLQLNLGKSKDSK